MLPDQGLSIRAQTHSVQALLEQGTGLLSKVQTPSVEALLFGPLSAQSGATETFLTQAHSLIRDTEEKTHNLITSTLAAQLDFVQSMLLPLSREVLQIPEVVEVQLQEVPVAHNVSHEQGIRLPACIESFLVQSFTELERGVKSEEVTTLPLGGRCRCTNPLGTFELIDHNPITNITRYSFLPELTNNIEPTRGVISDFLVTLMQVGLD